jgi:hypothetical protein
LFFSGSGIGTNVPNHLDLKIAIRKRFLEIEDEHQQDPKGIRMQLATSLIRSLGTLVIVVAALNSGCAPSSRVGGASSAETLSEKSALLVAETTANPYWKKRWWLEKTARLLRGGQGLSATDDVESLMKLSEEEIVRTLMKDDRFSETILDFNSYFLGFKMDKIRESGRLNPRLINFSSAVASALEISRNGDFYRLFDFTGPVYIAPLNPVTRFNEQDKDLNDAQVREKHAREIQTELDAALKFAQLPGVTTKAACEKLALVSRSLNSLFNDGYPFQLVFTGIYLNPDWIGKLQNLCREPTPITPLAFITGLKDIFQRNVEFFKEMTRFESANGYTVKKLSEARQIDLKRLQLPERLPAINFEQAQALGNSSTNLNRKRSAYVLKHFFCDDLTPLGFESPEKHTGGTHGSDTACYACHYKLDPMAGFFKNFGLFFSDFSREKLMIFDDGATQDREQYQNNWRASGDDGRKWNIGYVRSSGARANNSYGENLDDLSRIIREAPEVKKCLVRRMFEYFVAKNQTIDAGYLQYLTDGLIKDSSTNSVKAIMNTVTRLMLSNAYHEHDMDPKQCYDFAPGDDRTRNRVPCRVAYLITNNCVKCHDNADDELHGNLDLSRWVDTGNGVMGFPHLDKRGNQRPARETLNLILERLATTDPKRRMPLQMTISSQDRQELFIWAQETYQSLPGGDSK